MSEPDFAQTVRHCRLTRFDCHPGHGSCEGFGQATKGLAHELGGLGGFVTSVPPGAVDDLAAGGHAVFCEQK